MAGWLIAVPMVKCSRIIKLLLDRSIRFVLFAHSHSAIHKFRFHFDVLLSSTDGRTASVCFCISKSCVFGVPAWAMSFYFHFSRHTHTSSLRPSSKFQFYCTACRLILLVCASIDCFGSLDFFPFCYFHGIHSLLPPARSLAPRVHSIWLVAWPPLAITTIH